MVRGPVPVVHGRSTLFPLLGGKTAGNLRSVRAMLFRRTSSTLYSTVGRRMAWETPSSFLRASSICPLPRRWGRSDSGSGLVMLMWTILLTSASLAASNVTLACSTRSRWVRPRWSTRAQWVLNRVSAPPGVSLSIGGSSKLNWWSLTRSPKGFSRPGCPVIDWTWCPSSRSLLVM